MKNLFLLIILFTASVAMAYTVRIDSIQFHVACDCNLPNISGYVKTNPGYINIYASGTNTPFTYSIDSGITWQSSGIFTSLCGKKYNLVVKDNSGNSIMDTVNLLKAPVCNAPNPPVIISDNLLQQNVAGAVPCVGIDSLITSGGVPPLQFLLLDTSGKVIIHNWQTSAVFDSLCTGYYYVNVIDADAALRDRICPVCYQDTGKGAGTLGLYEIHVTQKCVGLNVVVTTINPDCAGLYPGEAYVHVTGGTAPYTYSWSNYATGETDYNLYPGSYSLTVSDASGCTGTGNFYINSYPPFIDSTSSTNVIQQPESPGSATVYLSNDYSNAPYTYIWSNGATGQTDENLSCGTYTVTVTDNKGCAETSTATVYCLTGIQELNPKMNFKIYPNPAEDILNIEILSDGRYNLQIINILGETVYCKSEAGTIIYVSTGDLAKGIYSIRVQDLQSGQLLDRRLVLK